MITLRGGQGAASAILSLLHIPLSQYPLVLELSINQSVHYIDRCNPGVSRLLLTGYVNSHAHLSLDITPVIPSHTFPKRQQTYRPNCVFPNNTIRRRHYQCSCPHPVLYLSFAHELALCPGGQAGAALTGPPPPPHFTSFQRHLVKICAGSVWKIFSGFPPLRRPHCSMLVVTRAIRRSRTLSVVGPPKVLL